MLQTKGQRRAGAAQENTFRGSPLGASRAPKRCPNRVGRTTRVPQKAKPEEVVAETASPARSISLATLEGLLFQATCLSGAGSLLLVPRGEHSPLVTVSATSERGRFGSAATVDHRLLSVQGSSSDREPGATFAPVALHHPSIARCPPLPVPSPPAQGPSRRPESRPPPATFLPLASRSAALRREAPPGRLPLAPSPSSTASSSTIPDAVGFPV